MLTVSRFVSLLLGALNLALAWAHLMEMGPKRVMSGLEWLATQQIYRDYGGARCQARGSAAAILRGRG